MKDITLWPIRAESLQGAGPFLPGKSHAQRMTGARRFRLEKDRIHSLASGYLMMKAEILDEFQIRYRETNTVSMGMNRSVRSGGSICLFHEKGLGK